MRLIHEAKNKTRQEVIQKKWKTKPLKATVFTTLLFLRRFNIIVENLRDARYTYLILLPGGTYL